MENNETMNRSSAAGSIGAPSGVKPTSSHAACNYFPDETRRLDLRSYESAFLRTSSSTFEKMCNWGRGGGGNNGWGIDAIDFSILPSLPSPR